MNCTPPGGEGEGRATRQEGGPDRPPHRGQDFVPTGGLRRRHHRAGCRGGHQVQGFQFNRDISNRGLRFG